MYGKVLSACTVIQSMSAGTYNIKKFSKLAVNLAKISPGYVIELLTALLEYINVFKLNCANTRSSW